MYLYTSSDHKFFWGKNTNSVKFHLIFTESNTEAAVWMSYLSILCSGFLQRSLLAKALQKIFRPQVLVEWSFQIRWLPAITISKMAMALDTSFQYYSDICESRAKASVVQRKNVQVVTCRLTGIVRKTLPRRLVVTFSLKSDIFSDSFLFDICCNVWMC